MKILITILLALFISSNTYADEERANRDRNIMEFGEVLASGVLESSTMVMIMKYKTSLFRCVIYDTRTKARCWRVNYG
jgi:hypothetical protein